LSRFVLDCSVCAAWLFEEDWGGYPLAVLSELDVGEAIVPALWQYEVGNALIIGERRGRVAVAKTARFLEMLRGLRITVDSRPAAETIDRLLDLARRHRLTAYDAAYLELALREGFELATLDDALRAAAAVAGVKLFQPAAAGSP
jgi:predicted nucleic acid-binding protein